MKLEELNGPHIKEARVEVKKRSIYGPALHVSHKIELSFDINDFNRFSDKDKQDIIQYLSSVERIINERLLRDD